MRERFLINPVRKRRISTRKKGGGTVTKRNPARRTTRKAVRRVTARRKPRKITVYKTGKRTYSRSPLSKSKRRGIKINPSLAAIGANRPKRRKRRNPPTLVNQIVKQAPLYVTGAGAVMATKIIPGMIKVQQPIMKYGVQLGIAIGGGMVLGKAVNRNHGVVFTTVGMATILAEILDQYVLKGAFGLSAYDLSAYELEDDMMEDEYEDDMGAFPTMDAFPTEEAF